MSARRIFYPRSREERNKSLSFSFPSFNAWERARRAPLARAGETSAREPRESFLVLLHTHTSGWLRKWSGITERNSRRELRPPRDGREAYPVLVFPFLLCFFFFSFFFKSYLGRLFTRVWIASTGPRIARGPKYRFDSLIQAASNPPLARYIYLHTFLNKQTTADAFSLSAVKKILFLFLVRAAGRLTSRGLRHGSVGVQRCGRDGWMTETKKRGKIK